VSRIGVIVLAAGRSSRFGAGAHKLLAPIGGVPLIRFAASAAVEADVGDVVVVTGAQAAAVASALEGLPVRVVHERAFADGMAISLRCGITALHGLVDAVLIALGDQPGMRPEAYHQVARRWETSNAGIVVPRYLGATAPAHPTLFGAAMFGELLALEGDAGARSVIARDPSRVVEAALGWPAPHDVDTLEDLECVATEIANAGHSLHDRTRMPRSPTHDSR
jgi:molybdenum cofactor cytidylyltransferase